MLVLPLITIFFHLLKAESSLSDVSLYTSWDYCPPTCALADIASITHPVKVCDRDNHPHPADYRVDPTCNVVNVGNAYTCADQSPWAVNETTSYGFAEVHDAQCCGCYHLSLPPPPGDDRTRTMVVQNINQPTSPSTIEFIYVLVGSRSKRGLTGILLTFRSTIGSGTLPPPIGCLCFPI